MPLTKVASSMLASGASGSGGSTGKNYISSYNNGSCNGDFESGSISGWSLCSVASITNGLPSTLTVGAAAQITPSLVSGSGQLAGQYSYQTVLNNSLASVALQGFCSDVFTIDAEDLAKVLTFKFYYQATSGASNGNFSGTSSNTFLVSIYAVNGAAAGTFLQPAGLYGMTQSSGAGIATGTFQTYSDTTQYRFVVLCANNITASSTMTVVWDDFQVGPQTAPIGPVVTDWSSNLTFSPNNFGTITTSAYRTKRIGDQLEVVGNFTPFSTTTQIASISLPAGYTIDSTKLPSSSSGTIVGHFVTNETAASNRNIYYAASSSATNDVGILFYDGSDTSKVYMTAFSQSSVLQKVNTNNWLVAPISFTMTLPITGFSSNVQMSNDTDTRVCAASYYQGTNTGQSATCLDFPTKDYDTHGAVTTGSGLWKFTAPISGYYNAEVYYSGVANTSISLLRDGASFTQNSFFNSLSTGTNNGSITVYLNAGQYIQIYAAGATGVMNGRVTIKRLSGPSVIAATESVNARYYSSSSSVSGSLGTVTYATKDFDTHGAYSGGIYTIPVSGKYQVTAGLSITYASTATGTTNLAIFKGANQITDSFTYNSSTGTATPSNLISDTISCLAGDQITIKASCSASTPVIRTSNFYNFFTITRVGN